MKKWYLSKFIHVFQKDGVFALYQVLRIKPIYVDADTYEKIKLFSEGITIKKFFKNIPDDQKNDYKNLIKNLKKLDFIIADRDEDDEVFNNILKTITDPYPHIVYLMMADTCNLACRYCFEGMNREESNDCNEKLMSKEVLINFVNTYARILNSKPEIFNDEKKIIFYGGEPLMNYEQIAFALDLILDYQKRSLLPENIKFSIITNGTLLSDEIIKKFKDHKVSVSISFDGGRAENVNRVYSNGHEAYDRISNFIDKCIAIEVETSISCTLSENNIDSFPAVMNMIDEKKVHYLGFNMMLGETSEKYFEKASNFIIESYKVFREKGIFEDRIYRKLKAFSQSEVLVFDCAAAGGHQMVISPDGTVGICHGFFSNRKYFEGSVHDHLFNPIQSDIFKEWNQRTPFNMPECKDCPGISICGGGCLMNAEKLYGSIWEKDKQFCIHCLKTLEWMIWDLYESLV